LTPVSRLTFRSVNLAYRSAGFTYHEHTCPAHPLSATLTYQTMC